MLKIFADAESYYDSKTYTLRQMTPVEYILDARWETIGWSVAVNNEKPFWLEGDEFASYLERVTEPYAFITHNALFDACILAYRYGIYPKLCVDTMSMARALISHKTPRGSVSLDNVAAYLELGAKGKTVHNVNGMRLAQIKAMGLYPSYVAYGLQDVSLCRGIYNKLAPLFPAKEFVINHMVIEMATRPQFVADVPSLYQYQAEILAQKQTLLDRVGIDKSELMSNDKFALALERLGVEPPRKISPTTGLETFAFAKNDLGMVELEEHDDPDVQALIAARVGFKSTIEETRTARFIRVAEVTRLGNGESPMPIPLKYSGAHTHRFSGDWKLNMQNLKRGGTLRRSLKAPEGHLVMPCDAAQIECRINAWICGETELTAQFARGEDVYSILATDIYGEPVTKKQKDKRQVGKRAELGLGFGASAPVLYRALYNDNRDFGLSIEMDLDFAKRVVSIYRGKRRNIVATWKWLNNMLPYIADGSAEGMMFGPCVFEKGAILLPTGLRLQYQELRYEGGNWTFWNGRFRKKVYGGLMLENVVQALDRVLVMDAAVRIVARARREMGIDLVLAHQVHDEVVFVPRIEWVDELEKIMLEEMRRRPSWGLDMPLDAETGKGLNYGEAK